MRIVSLVPSLTAFLHYLNLETEVVGITKFCIHPAHWFETKTRIGGTKNCNHEAIEKLQPTLIIANKEENTKADVEQLQKKYFVYVSEIATVQEAIKAFTDIGKLVDKEKEVKLFIQLLQKDFAFLYAQNFEIKNYVYLIWRKPYMVAGSDTYIHSVLALGNYKNLIEQPRYPEITVEQLKALNPTNIFLSSEPYPFKQKHIDELLAIIPDAKIQLVDGEILSWYGSKMLEIKNYLLGLRA